MNTSQQLRKPDKIVVSNLWEDKHLILREEGGWGGGILLVASCYGN